MKKLTLKFNSFGELSAFSKTLTIGYLINTNTLTITAKLLEFQISIAQRQFCAELMETNEGVYGYDPF